MLLVPAVDSWCFCHIFSSCNDYPQPLNSSKDHPVVPVTPRQQMDWLLVRLWQLVWWTEQKEARRRSSTDVLPSRWFEILPLYLHSLLFEILQPTSWKALGGGICALLLVTPPLSPHVQAWRVECNMWHLQFSMAYCFLIMVWRLCAAMVVLKAWKTCRVPISLRLYPFTQRRASTSTSSCALPNLSAWVLQGGSQPSLFLPPAPLESRRLGPVQQRRVTEWWESLGPALLTDGWPVWLYLSRTDAALAVAHRLSLLTVLSEPDL